MIMISEDIWRYLKMWNVSYILFLWCLSTMKSMNTCSTCSTCSLGPWRLTLKRFLMQVPSQYPLARQMVIGKPQVGELGHALHMVCINHGVFMIYWDSLYTDYIWLSLPVSYISVSDYLIISDYIWLYIYIWLYLIISDYYALYISVSLPQVRFLESVELPAGWCHPDSSAHDAQSTWACTVLGHPTFETEYWHILTMQGAAVKDPKQHKQIKKRQAWQPWQQYYNSNYYNHLTSFRISSLVLQWDGESGQAASSSLPGRGWPTTGRCARSASGAVWLSSHFWDQILLISAV